MKFLFFTDMHIKGVNPGKRKDVFYIAILQKLQELEQVIKNENINFVVIGGDLFDSPKISNQLLGEVARIIKSWKVRTFVVPGNHDVYGQNISTLPHTSLGVLERTGLVSILTRDISPVYIGKRNDPDYPLVAFTGQEYYQEIDTGVNNDYEVEQSNGDVDILVAHGMLLEKPFHPDIPFTLMKDVQSSADLILSGHYHPDEIDKEYNGIKFVKPRGAARLEATKHNVDHMPQYVIIDVSKSNNNTTINTDIRDFTWAPQGCDIFDYTGQVETKLYRNQLNEFKNQIRNIDLTNNTDLPDMIKKIASSEVGIEFEHIELSLKYLIASEKNSVDKTLDGFIPYPGDIAIDEVDITNYQSHKSTKLKFKDCALNALVGESNNGKSAIMRAIIWCLYNEPKGAEHIKEGEKFASVTITMSNGTKITRRRTNSETGYFEITDANGVATKYSKFGTNIPIEVYNAHQMPKITMAKTPMSLNVAAQLDGAFMLSFSSADRASAIGKLTKTDVVDNAILNVSKEIINHQRDIKVLERDVELLNQKIESYDFLEEENKALTHLEHVINDISNSKDTSNELAELRQNYNDSIVQTSMLRLQLASAPDTAKITSMLNDIDAGTSIIKSYGQLSASYQTSLYGIANSKHTLSNAGKIEKIKDITNVIEESLNRIKELQEVEQELRKNTVSLQNGAEFIKNLRTIDGSKLEELENSLKVLKEHKETKELYNSYLNSLEEVEKRTAQELEFIDNVKQKKQKYADTYKELLLEAGTCPICGSAMKDDFDFSL